MKFNKIFIGLLLALLLSSFALADFTTDNVLWASLQDAEDGNFDAHGGVTGIKGVVDGAYSFDGVDDHLIVPLTNFPASMSDATVSVWLSPSGESEQASLLNTQTSSGSNTFNIHFPWTNDNYYFDFGDLTNGGRLTGDWDDSWNGVMAHYVFTVEDGVGMKMYRNGILIDSVGTSSTFTKGGQEMRVGWYSPGDGNEHMEMDLDEFKIFDKALTPTEINNLYNSGSREENEVALANQVFYANLNSLYDYSSKGESTYTNNGATKVNGILDDAWDFDGSNDYIEIPDTNINYDDDFSFSLWFNGDSFGDNKFLIDLLESNNFRVKYEDSADEGIWFVSYDGSINNYVFVPTADFNTNTWYHLVGVRDKDVGMEIYLDGISKDTNSFTGNGAVQTQGNRIAGSSYGTSTQHFDGTLDELKLYDKALSQSEVTTLYNSGTPEYNEVAITNQVFYMNAKGSNPLSAYNGVTYDATENAFDFDGTDDYISLPEEINPSLASDLTFSAWIKPETLTSTNTLLYQWQGGGSASLNLKVATRDTGKVRFDTGNGGGSYDTSLDSTTVLSTGQEYFITVVRDCTTNMKYIYIDGALDASSTAPLCGGLSDIVATIGTSGGNDNMDGFMSGVTMYNTAFTQTEISDLYAEGRDYNPYTTVIPPEPTGDFFYPRVTEEEQGGKITVDSLTYVPIISGSVVIDNTTNISFSATGFVKGKDGADSIANCRITFDGNEVGTTITAPPKDKRRSFYINTELTEVTAGTYDGTFECKKDGVNKFEIEQSNVLLTQYINGVGVPLNVLHEDTNSLITSSSYTQIGTFNFTTEDNVLPEGATRYVVFDSSTTNSYDSDGTVCLKASSFGQDSPEYCRYGTAGGFGSGGTFEFVEEVPANTTITIQLYGKSTSSDGEVDVHITAYEMISHSEEIAQLDLTDIDFTTDALTVVASVDFENAEHTSIDTMIKSGFSVQSNIGNDDMRFQLSITGDDTQEGNIIRRDVLFANQEGLVTLQAVFPDLPLGNYTANLLARTKNGDATITDGSLVAITVNDEPFTPDTYAVGLANLWDGSPLDTFTVTDEAGTIYDDEGNGFVNIISYKPLEDLLFQKVGYVDRTYLDHDTTTNLEGEMYQSVVVINYKTIFSNQSIQTFTVTDPNEGAFTTTNGVLVMYPNLGVYDWDITATGYYDLLDYEFTVDEQAESFIVQKGSDTQATLTLTDLTSGLPVDTYTINLTSLEYNYTASLSTTGGTLTFDGLENGDYNVFVDAAGYAYNDQNFTLAAGANPIDIDMFRTNTINISFFDETTKALIVGTNITLDLVSEHGSYSYSTTTGNVYEELLSPSGYNIRYSAPGYDTRYYYFELVDRTSTTIELYLLDEAESNIITVSVIDENAQAVEEALVKVLKFDVSTSQYILQQSLFTDADGEVQFSVQFNEEFYYFVVEYPVKTQLAQTSPALIFKDTLLIQLNIGSTGGEGWIVKNDITSSIVYYRDTAEFVFKYNDAQNTASEGCLYIYDDKYNSSSLIASGCASGPVNTVTVSVPGTNGSYYQAKGFVEISGSPLLVATKQVVIPLGSVLDFNSLFLVAILILAFAMTAIKTGPAAVVVLPVIGLAFARMAGILSTYLTWGVIGSLLIVSIILSFIVKRRFF